MLLTFYPNTNTNVIVKTCNKCIVNCMYLRQLIYRGQQFYMSISFISVLYATYSYKLLNLHTLKNHVPGSKILPIKITNCKFFIPSINSDKHNSSCSNVLYVKDEERTTVFVYCEDQ